MNCKPHQPAWIKVPKAMQKYGVETLHNRVVMTVDLLPRNASPIWNVDPPQVIRVTGPIRDAAGTRAAPGQVFEFTAIPDAWLVPLKGESEPTVDGAIPVLEQTA